MKGLLADLMLSPSFSLIQHRPASPHHRLHLLQARPLSSVRPIAYCASHGHGIGSLNVDYDHTANTCVHCAMSQAVASLSWRGDDPVLKACLDLGTRVL